MNTCRRLHPSAITRQSERGVVLLFALIALVVMLIGGVAMVRSFNTSLFTAGNIAFKRDLQNQGERAVPVVLARMLTGTLNTPALRGANLRTSNYSAAILPTTAQGIPSALIGNDAAFNAVADTNNDIAVAGQGVTIRYVVDRLCNAVGLDTTLGPDRCSLAEGNAPTGGSGSELLRAEDASAAGAGAVKVQVVYRLSIRVDGPRNTQAFFQTTFTL